MKNIYLDSSYKGSYLLVHVHYTSLLKQMTVASRGKTEAFQGH